MPRRAAVRARRAMPQAPQGRLTGSGGADRRQRLPGSLSRVPGVLQRKPQLGAADDAHEQVADRVAARVSAGGLAPEIAPMGTAQIQRAAAGPAGPQGAAQATAAVTSGGRGLTPQETGFFEPRFGRDLSDVRVHEGAAVDAAADAIGARAFTLGRDIGVASGQYDPGSDAGRRLMAHELTHVVQQSGAPIPLVQRLTHDATTPTNCHNWLLPLPPWTAGSIAHAQAAIFFAINSGSAGRILPEAPMPRGSKIFKGQTTQPWFPRGFMDLTGVSGSRVQIAEIKSTASAHEATPEAQHYMGRHIEWMARFPWTDRDDKTYAKAIKGRKPPALMNGLHSVTGTGLKIGTFNGDPGKQLHLEADKSGAVCYWCTGAGITNPVWAKVFQKAMKSVVSKLWDAYRAVLELAETALAFVNAHRYAFAVLLAIVAIAIVIALISTMSAPASGGTSMLGTILALGLALKAALACMALLGVNTGGFGRAAKRMQAAIQDLGTADKGTAANYERDADLGGWSGMTAAANTAPASMEKISKRFVKRSKPVPGRITKRLALIFLPGSGVQPPSPDKQSVAMIKKVGKILAAHPDQSIADTGKDIEDMVKRI